MDEKKKILSVDNLKLWMKNDYGRTQILNGISFDIYSGEILGIVGESGCGKSMTSLSIMRLLETPPAIYEGSIRFQSQSGRAIEEKKLEKQLKRNKISQADYDAALKELDKGTNMLNLTQKQMQRIRGKEMSMIFQEPMTSLNPLFTLGNQLSEPFMQHQGLSRREAYEKSVEMLRMVRVAEPEQRVDEYPYQLSGGMRQRVMIAMALACKPDLLIADEPTTALDVTIQAQVLYLMKELQNEMGTAIAFITHDLGVINQVCDRVVVLYCGEVMETAEVKELFRHPLHPYTEGLLSTLPKFGQHGKLNTIPGMVPPAGHFPAGCVFAPRCPYATDRCRSEEKPGLYDCGDGHMVRCFRYEH